MRLRHSLVLALLVLLAVLLGPGACSPGRPADGTAGTMTTDVSSTTSTPASSVREDTPETVLASLSLEQKAAQVLLVGFQGKEPDQELRRLIDEGPPAGVIFFARNVGSAQEITGLNDELQRAAASAAAQAGPRVSLLIAVDQEGGPVARLRDGVPSLPAARETADSQTPAQAERSAYGVALALRRLGVNLNLAPVLDVVGAPESFLYRRSCGSTAESVAAYGLAVIRGYAAGGIITSAKHFPGHGSASGDTHEGVVRSTLSREELEEHLAPFVAAVQAGVPTVLVSHVVVEALDPERPASLSSTVIEGTLRRESGFRGVAVSDDLEMLGALQNTTIGQAAVQALQAGVDLLILGGHQQNPVQARDALIEAVEEGYVSTERLDEAVLRVLRLKEDFGLLSD